MTDNRRAKQDARERAKATGERYTTARRATAAPATDQVRFFEPDHCANCLDALPEAVEGLFCSELCSQTADTVRYWRRVTRDGRLADSEVQLAIKTRVAHLLAGGYRRKARRLSDATRALVWQRDSGRCVACGEPGTEIDHIASDSAEMSNLQLLCRECHLVKTAQQMVPSSESQALCVRELIEERVAPTAPALLCDDEVGWAYEWRSLKSARGSRLLDHLGDLGYERSQFPGRSWAEMWEEVLDAEADIDDMGRASEEDDSGYGPGSYFAHAMANDV